MEEILLISVVKSVARFIGINSRYFFLKSINKKASFKSLSNESRDEYRDLGQALNQDFLNVMVGSIVLSILIIITVGIVLS